MPLTDAITAAATRPPSTAALTIPPAYPAPSPAGNNPEREIDSHVVACRET